MDTNNERLQKETPFHRRIERRGRGRWILGGVLVLLAGAAVWFGYPAWKQNRALVGDVPSLKQAAQSLKQRVDSIAGSVDAKLRGWQEEQTALDSRVTKLEGRLSAGLASANKHADEVSQQTYSRMTAELDQRLAATESRLAKMEASGSADQNEIAGLRAQLNGIRDTIHEHTVQLAGVRDDGVRDRSLLEEHMANLDRRVSAGDKQFDTYKQDHAMVRLDFEATKNQRQKLADGVELDVTGIDVAHRQVKGWMWIMPDRKTIWLRDQNAMEPVVFYSDKDNRRREVVFTQVTKDAAIGYVLMPAAEASGAEQLAMTARGN